MRRAIVAVALLLSGCGGDDEQVRGYLAKSATAALFLQWNERDGALDGTLRTARLRGDENGVLDVAREESAVSGTIGDGRLRLTVAARNGRRDHWTGRRRDGQLVFRYRAGKRRLRTLRFRPAPDRAFEAAVDRLEGSIHEYPTEAVQTFVRSCDAQPNVSASECKCVVQRLQLSMPYGEFERADKAVRDQRPVPAAAQRKLVEAASVCR